MRKFDLKNVVEGAVAYALLATLTGCSDDGLFDGQLQASDLTPIQCGDNSPFAAMKLSEDFDYVTLRTASDVFGTTNADGSPKITDEDELGMHCAADDTSCKQAFADAIPESDDWSACAQIGCERRGLVTIKDGVVALHDDAEEVLAVLGEIDTPEEAMLWANLKRFPVSCDESMRTTDEGYEFVGRRTISECPVTTARYWVGINQDGDVNERGQDQVEKSQACVGRRPDALCLQPRQASATQTPEAAFLSEVAELELAAVYAFDTIEQELNAFGAPQHLRDEAKRAARDEVRHAMMTTAFARKYGGAPRGPKIPGKPLRDKQAFALHNMVEGCVRETFGAAYAEHQAQTAQDAEFANAMRQIAIDERRHAELSWEMHAWLEPQLSRHEQREIEQAKQRAIAELRRSIEEQTDGAVCRSLGVPNRAAAHTLLDVLEAGLWSPGNARALS